MAASTAHDKRGIHMHVMARQIERDEALEHNRKSWECAGQEDQETGCGAAIGDHVQDRSEFGGLVEAPRCQAVKRIEQAAYAVEEAAGSRVQRHIIQRAHREHNSGVSGGLRLVSNRGMKLKVSIPDQVRQKEEDVLVLLPRRLFLGGRLDGAVLRQSRPRPCGHCAHVRFQGRSAFGEAVACA